MSKKVRKRISKKEIEHVSALANIHLTQKEQEKYSIELSNVVNYNMEHLDKVKTETIEPTAHAIGEKMIVRDDSTEPGFAVKEAMLNAPDEHNSLFKVKHIFGEE
jgi:aspartyl-tRNA(Asn)/glutamyl-tRNA(Gln) amidotransferase subunit C